MSIYLNMIVCVAVNIPVFMDTLTTVYGLLLWLFNMWPKNEKTF